MLLLLGLETHKSTHQSWGQVNINSEIELHSTGENPCPKQFIEIDMVLNPTLVYSSPQHMYTLQLTSGPHAGNPHTITQFPGSEINTELK
jgi:hypothetical protein